jgi:hypothetical protein
MKWPWIFIKRAIVERMQHHVVESVERACKAEIEAAHARTAKAQAETQIAEQRIEIAGLTTRAALAEAGCVNLTLRLDEAPPAPIRVLH